MNNPFRSFIGYAWESDVECDVDFKTEDGEMEQKHVSVSWLEPAQKTYNNKVMEALMQRKGLKPGDASKDSDIMSMAKQDAFNEYCE